MKGISLVWRTDLHMADNAPQSRLDNWPEVMAEKLTQVGRIARRVKADAVLDGGDLFHIKSPWKNSHGAVHQICVAHRHYPCPVYATIGNHDCVYGDYSYIDQQPLGVLFDTGTFRRLYDKHEALFEIHGFTVRVVGIPYHGADYDLERFRSIEKGDEDYLVVVAHVLATPGAGGKGAMFGGEDIVGYDFLRTLDADVFCFGHWHKDQGIVEIAEGKWVVNVGSMSRGALSQDEMKRIPACVTMHFDTEGITLEKVLLSVAPASDVFDIEKKERIEAKEFTSEAFADSLRNVLNSVVGESLETQIRVHEGVLPEVRERALHYWEQVS